MGTRVVVTGDSANWRHGFDAGEVGTVHSEFGEGGYLVEDGDEVPWHWAVHESD